MPSLRIREKPLHPGEITLSVGGCQASIFNYTKDPHKETQLLLVYCMRSNRNDIPRGWLSVEGGGGDEFTGSFQTGSWISPEERDPGHHWRSVLSLLESHHAPSLPSSLRVPQDGCRLPDPAVRIQLFTPTQDPPSSTSYEGPCQNAESTLIPN